MAGHKQTGGGPTGVRRVAFYVRVSTEGQARVVEGSLKNQEQMLAAELRRRNTGGRWGRHIGSYIDGGFSGSSIDRPEFKRSWRTWNAGPWMRFFSPSSAVFPVRSRIS